jgi:hypothetical protein
MGAIGIGIVWGWLIGNKRQRKLPTILSFSAGTLLLTIEVSLFERWKGLVSFLIAGSFAWLLNSLWRGALRMRFTTPS